MARIAGIDLPANKNVEIGLTYVFGIGRSLSKKIIAEANIDPVVKVSKLQEKEVLVLRDVVRKYLVEGDLRKEISLNIRRLAEVGSLRGIRHRRSMPVRGQRTRTNARTRRGKRKTVKNKKKEVK